MWCFIADKLIRKGGYAQDYFTLRSTYFQGRPPKSVNMYWRRYAVPDIPVDDHEAFDAWVTQRWREKDELLDQYLRTGRFPSSELQAEDQSGAEDGFINTEVKIRSFQEIGTIFVVLATLTMVVRLGGKFWGMRHVFLSQALEQRKELFGY